MREHFHVNPTKNNLKLNAKWLEFELWRSQRHLNSVGGSTTTDI